ncbi:hypothetical protein WMY93_012604 [Mugilogobius chulae]|uniref:Guanosine-3',5'-bis(diphosphate) 3'-pyrophosphohydrolase MESH1 n=1 Tax=Mugilogobius chulae TaxID=88201 RepID=A0AAW0NXX6_9GOBI
MHALLPGTRRFVDHFPRFTFDRLDSLLFASDPLLFASDPLLFASVSLAPRARRGSDVRGSSKPGNAWRSGADRAAQQTTDSIPTMESSSDVALLLETVNFAAEKHRNQRRKDAAGTPYINHPIGVARILSHEAGVTDVCVLQAALLHDTVEDTDTTLDELQARFGPVVSGIVAEVTDDKSLPKAERKRLQVEHARHCSPRAKLVKLADKLYNLRDLETGAPQGWSEERVQQYFVWACDVVKGLRGTNAALEQKLDELFTKRGVPLSGTNA